MSIKINVSLLSQNLKTFDKCKSTLFSMNKLNNHTKKRIK